MNIHSKTVQTLWLSCRWAIVPMITGLFVFGLFLPSFLWNYELFHSLLMFSGSFAAFALSLFILSLIEKKRLALNYLWLIVSFTSMGILDLVHSLMPPGQEFVWLHSSATFVGGLFSALVWLPVFICKPFFNKWFFTSIIFISLSFSICSITFPELTPSMLSNNNQFTLSAEFLNFAGGLGFIIAWMYFVNLYHHQRQIEATYFSNQFLLFGLAALLFEVSELWDGNWWLWHMLRVFAYLILMIYFTKMYWNDLNDLAKQNQTLKLSAQVFKEAHEGIIITDAKATIIQVNPAFYRLTGYSPEEIIGQNPKILSSGKQSHEFYSQMWQVLITQNYWHGEIWNRKKSGECFAELLTISSIKNEQGDVSYYIGMFSDVTQAKQQQQKLELIAHYDVLTKLPNRILLSDRFTQAAMHCKRTHSLMAIGFLDLDNFKPINDTYGHHIGDQLLVEVAQRIKKSIREEDTVSRQGGDEFALLLGNIDSVAHCEQLLERIHDSIVQPYYIDKHTLSIGVSSGITLYPEDNADLDTLMRHADQSMYQAKLEGGNTFQFFNARDNNTLIEKHHQLQKIQQALVNNEFCLYYQPKVDMKTGKAYGAEALIRWLSPEQGIIPPLQFLPIIEGTDLEIHIGQWVLNEALQQLDKWQKQGIKLELSINISSKHLQSSSFLSDFEKILARYSNLNHQDIQIEILENSALDNLETISKIIKYCRDSLGISVALDDFGTGYSSLTHMRNLPVSTIKIDQSFVRDMLDDPNDYAIVEGVIALSKSFKRHVIAEGVESIPHGLQLISLGCHFAQGYAIARPMPAEEIPGWLTDYVPNKEWIELGNRQFNKSL